MAKIFAKTEPQGGTKIALVTQYVALRVLDAKKKPARRQAGRVLCGASWGLLGSRESQRSRAGRTVVVPGRAVFLGFRVFHGFGSKTPKFREINRLSL